MPQFEAEHVILIDLILENHYGLAEIRTYDIKFRVLLPNHYTMKHTGHCEKISLKKINMAQPRLEPMTTISKIYSLTTTPQSFVGNFNGRSDFKCQVFKEYQLTFSTLLFINKHHWYSLILTVNLKIVVLLLCTS